MLPPGISHPPGLQRTDTRHFDQPVGRVFQYRQGLFFKMGDEALGGLGTDSLDHARSQVAPYLLHTRRQQHFEREDLELLAVAWMGTPPAFQSQGFPGPGFGNVPQHRNQAGGFGQSESGDQKMGVGAAEGDAFDLAFQGGGGRVHGKAATFPDKIMLAASRRSSATTVG